MALKEFCSSMYFSSMKVFELQAYLKEHDIRFSNDGKPKWKSSL